MAMLAAGGLRRLAPLRGAAAVVLFVLAAVAIGVGVAVGV
jgi:hypothetical protein